MKASALFCLAFAATGLVFFLMPQIDPAVSAWFYEPGVGFELAGWLPLQIVERSIPWITGGIVAIVVTGSVSLAVFGHRIWRLDARALVFIALATALGPGILVNTVLKDHWGRARPAQTVLFGGTKQFTPAPLIADQCPRNCSFVSGHAALAFSLIDFALLVPVGPRRRAVIGGVVGFGTVVGLARIAAGGHFLSDVVYAGFLAMATSWLLYQTIIVHDMLGRALRTVAGRIALGAIALALAEAAAMRWLDRPLALYLHRIGGPLQPIFVPLGEFGLGFPYLVLFAAIFVGLRWGGAWPRLRRHRAAMRRTAAAPALLFAAVAVSGLVADVTKVVCGRTRPKLLFLDGTDAFTGFALRADHWSFPSGHATTAAALMMALWYLWPRYAPLYVIFALLIAASRVVTGEHYLSDTVMGAAIGVASVRALIIVFARHGYAPRGRSARAV